MGYEMKRGAKPKFNELGSSPIKGKGDNLKRIMSERKAFAKKTGTFYAPGAEPKINDPSKMPKNFNTKGSKGLLTNPTPGHSSTKIARAAAQDRAVDRLATRTDLSKVQFERKLAKITNTVNPYPETKAKHHHKVTKGPEAMKPPKKAIVKKASKASKLVKGAKKALKIGGKIVGGLGVAATLYDFYKSGQKHSGGKAVKGQKSFMADAKKNTKSIYKKK